MLTRVSCERCAFACLWTDDPQGFLQDACLKPTGCSARFRHQIVGTRMGSVERYVSPQHQGVLVRPGLGVTR